jgi:diaminohydroxyphosphoribosylaminopyrimidine deaminase/5-amino-6-(5-phosphoribosylamino)uracil reductase
VFWISDADSQQLAHRWRAEEQAILVGRKTVDDDNPQLTTRKWAGTHPIRLVIDPNNSIKENAQVLNREAKTVVFNNSLNKIEGNLSWVTVSTKDPLKGILDWCLDNEIQSIMIEGGATTLQGFLSTNLWDECRVIETKKYMKKGVKAPPIPEGKKTSKRIVGDVLRIIRNERHSARNRDIS